MSLAGLRRWTVSHAHKSQDGLQVAVEHVVADKIDAEFTHEITRLFAPELQLAVRHNDLLRHVGPQEFAVAIVVRTCWLTGTGQVGLERMY